MADSQSSPSFITYSLNLAAVTDVRQNEIADQLGQTIKLPVLYFSQVLGYALGLKPNILGLKKHIVDPIPIMLEKCKMKGADFTHLQEAPA